MNDLIFEQIKAEYEHACTKFPPFNSCHEGYAVLKEELDELWEIVKQKGVRRDVYDLRKEAIQVAAMAVKFIVMLDAQGAKK